MLFEQNSEQIAKPASKVLMESAGFDYVDGQLCFIFSTSEGKRGYGKQAIPVIDIDSCYEVLRNAAEMVFSLRIISQLHQRLLKNL